MANQEHLAILKQGVEVWNRWRSEYPDTRPDLSKADLKRYDLRDADLCNTDLYEADLSGTRSSGAKFIKANLNEALLNRSYFYGADFSDANLGGAELGAASLNIVKFHNTNLSGANLSVADLSGADLSGAILDYTKFAWNDLRFIKGLESIEYRGPCSVDVKSVYLPLGKMLPFFLRSVGFSDRFIDYLPSLLTNNAIEYSSCFISYSSQDTVFVKHLYSDLQDKGVRCWFAPEHLKIGDKIRSGIDEAIRHHDKLLLVFSKSSVASGWVEREVKTALAKERKEKRTVLFPIRVDRAVFDCPYDWASEIRHERNIGDFTRWKNHDDYQKAFTRLLRELKAESR